MTEPSLMLYWLLMSAQRCMIFCLLEFTYNVQCSMTSATKHKKRLCSCLEYECPYSLSTEIKDKVK